MQLRKPIRAPHLKNLHESKKNKHYCNEPLETKADTDKINQDLKSNMYNN